MKKNSLGYLTKALNAYLKLDDESGARLKKLRGKTITIEFLPFHFIFHCQFNAHGVVLHADAAEEANTTIRGTPLQMLNVMLTKNDRQKFFADDMVIEGDAEVGQQVIALFDEMHIDWEEYLAQVVGDVPAYHAGRMLRGLKSWLSSSEKTCAQNVSEFMHEEAEWFPAREALQDFFNDIDTLRMDVDRIEARIKQLRDLLQ